MSDTLFGDSRLPDRFWSKVEVSETGCWLWRGWTNFGGYGQFGVGQGHVAAHRVAYEALVDSVPASLVCDHLCRVRNCVNPAHIDIVTNAENIRRGVGAEVTRAIHAQIDHCPRGHAYTDENTYIRVKQGWRMRECRRCRTLTKLANQRHWRDLRKATPITTAGDLG